jgi:predicted GNAT family N-acyltransferase
MEEFQSISQLNDRHISQLLDLYKNEFWSKHRTRPDVEKMLVASDVVIALVDRDDRLAAFTRVLTDFVYRATIYDVIVNPIDRQKGLGKRLMDEVFQHSELSQVEYFSLFCLPEMIPFYERWGFTADTQNMQLMFRSQGNTS